MDQWPNQEALNRALNHFRSNMRDFIVSNLKCVAGKNIEDTILDSLWQANRADRVNEIEDRLLKQSNRDIKSIIDIDDFPHLINSNWIDSFKDPLLNDKYFRNQLWLIKAGRDESWAHPPDEDTDPEATRTNIFLIADVLRKINRHEAKIKVERIRDELFHDDTPERLEKVEEQLKNIENEKEKLESDKKESENKLENLQDQVRKLESQKNKLQGDLATKSQEMLEKNQKLNTTTTQLQKSKERIKKSSEDKKEAKGRINTLEEQIEGMQTNHNLEKTALKKQLTAMTEVIQEKNVLTDSLSELLSIITLNQPDGTIFPQVNINSSVRIIDQRKTNRKIYLFNLLKLKQPSIYYVHDEDRMYEYLTEHIPNISDAIEKHNCNTPKEDEKELLERLKQGELNVIVSNNTFSLLPKNENPTHIVFCNLSPGIEAFINRCQPAFLSDNNCFIHLIYDCETDLNSISNSFPDRDAFNTFYKNLKCIDGIETNFISTDKILNELDIEKPAFNSICNIFQEIGMIQKNNNNGLKLLPSPNKPLENSIAYNEGVEKRKKFQEFYDFQKSHSSAELWDRIGEKAEISNILKDYNNPENVLKSGLEERIESIETESTDSTLE